MQAKTIMKNIKIEEFIDFVENQQEKWLYTLAKKAKYKVRVVRNGSIRSLEYFVGSTKNWRIHDRKFLDRVIERFNEISSFKKSDYQELTVNASYDLALINAFLQGKR